MLLQYKAVLIKTRCCNVFKWLNRNDKYFQGPGKIFHPLIRSRIFFSCHTQDYLNYVHVIGDKNSFIL